VRLVSGTTLTPLASPFGGGQHLGRRTHLCKEKKKETSRVKNGFQENELSVLAIFLASPLNSNSPYVHIIDKNRISIKTHKFAVALRLIWVLSG